MYNVLNIGKSGLNANQKKMDAIADDLANMSTNGYKKKEISFQELLINEIYDNEVVKSNNVNYAGINTGTRSGISKVNFEQGVILPSEGEFHLAIEGTGFFGIRDGNENLLLTRNGGFHINEDNSISDDSGYQLEMEWILPREQWGNGEVLISSQGMVSKQVDGDTIDLGRIVLFQPEVLDTLVSLGEGRYLPNENVPLYNSIAQGQGFGKIMQYALENSNVQVVKTMADMISTQRAYSLNAKSLQTTDDIMSFINNIKQ